MKLIDADNVVFEFKRMLDNADERNAKPDQKEEFKTIRTYIEWARYVVECVPTIDAVEVVRCNDCKWYHQCHKKISIREYDEDIQCNYARFEKIEYCSFGEKKDED